MEGMILIIALGAVIILSILFQIIRGGFTKPVAGKNKSAIIPRKFNAFVLRRISLSYGLDHEQTRLLEYVFRNDAVSDPDKVMNNPTLLDRHFKRAFKAIEKNSATDEDAQQNLVKLFSLRNAIEASSAANSGSSGQLSENMPAILGIGNDNFPVKVLVSKAQTVITEIPRNTLGTPMRFTKGTKVALSFFTKSSSGFSLDGQITGTTNTDQGPGLQIVHNGKSKPLVKRKSRRKQTDIECDFFFVNVEEIGTGRKKTSKLVVDSKKFSGTVKDISIGGCSIKTTAPIQVGTRLKLSLDYDDSNQITVLGQVIRSNRSGIQSFIHIKFLKVPRRAFNSISTLVFGYNDQ
jgi:hypothetical protein